MSKEAKIGLLLGLIFIVAIAVILKGVHQESINDLGEKEMFAQNKIIQPEPINLVVTRDLSNDKGSTTNKSGVTGNPVGGTTSDKVQDIRYQAPLPGNPDTVSRVNPPSEVTLLPVTKTVDGQSIYQHAIPEIPSIDSIKLGNLSGFYLPNAGKKDPVIAKNFGENKSVGETTGQPRETQVNAKQAVIVSGKEYTVAKGDDLTKIAIKFYGAKEGARWANVKGIFDANNKVIEDINRLKLGSKIVIPDLAKSVTTETTKTNTVQDKGTATKAPEVKKSEEKTQSGKTEEVRYYTVAKGDNLWSIAQKQLGNGNRHAELMDQDGKSLKNKTLQPGMKIKMPAK